MLTPDQIFQNQPITIPASLVNQVWGYIASKPSAETAMLVITFQQAVGAQMKALEDAANASQLTEAPVETTPAA